MTLIHTSTVLLVNQFLNYPYNLARVTPASALASRAVYSYFTLITNTCLNQVFNRSCKSQDPFLHFAVAHSCMR
jgi:hypothetical protein